MKREPKRICSATTSAGKPCRAVAVTADGLCAAHGGLVDMQAIGKQGGLRRGKTAALVEQRTDEEQARADIEQGMEAHREIVRTSGNAAARSRSAPELIRLARELERLRVGSGATAEDARAQLVAKLDGIEARRRINAEVCETCGGSGYVQRAMGPGAGAGNEGVRVCLSREVRDPRKFQERRRVRRMRRRVS